MDLSKVLEYCIGVCLRVWMHLYKKVELEVLKLSHLSCNFAGDNFHVSPFVNAQVCNFFVLTTYA
jgi:hypothetical protein